jgi:glycosyltransferase involved in cell wall biosynthesis
MALGVPRHVRDDLDRFSPSLIHVSAPDFLGTGAQKYAQKRGVPVVASYHTRFKSYFEYYRMGFLRAWARERQARFYRSSRRVLAPNSAIIGELQDMGLEQSAIRLWSRGVDIRKFNPGHRDMAWRRANGFADTDVVVTFLGRLVLEKGIRLFASVIDMLVARGCKVRPLVIGSGPAEGAFRAGLPEASYMGHLDGTALSTALASSDILLHPSKTEAFGNVVLESMASGVAVVSPDVPSASALITNRIDGLLLGAGCSDLASGVQWLVDHPSARKNIGQAAARSAARYQWDAINDAAIASYLEIMPREDVRAPVVVNLEDEPPDARDTVWASFSH